MSPSRARRRTGGRIREKPLHCPFASWVEPGHGLTNFSTNSSFGCGGSGVFLSLGSLGLRRNFPSSTSLKPAASTS